jgi:hypothetical protein
MPRPKLNEGEKKEKKITVRYRTCEMEQLLEQADASGLNLSELVRRRSLHRRVDSKTDLRTIAELRRFGGLLKHIYIETDGSSGPVTGPLVDDVRAVLIRIGREEGAE